MKWSVGTKISAGFAITLAIFVAVGLTAYRSTAQLVEAAEWTRHTYEVLGKIQQLPGQLRAYEFQQRSYILTTDAVFLDEFNAAQRALEHTIDNIRELTADNPRQQAQLNRLDPILRN